MHNDTEQSPTGDLLGMNTVMLHIYLYCAPNLSWVFINPQDAGESTQCKTVCAVSKKLELEKDTTGFSSNAAKQTN